MRYEGINFPHYITTTSQLDSTTNQLPRQCVDALMAIWKCAVMGNVHKSQPYKKLRPQASPMPAPAVVSVSPWIFL